MKIFDSMGELFMSAFMGMVWVTVVLPFAILEVITGRDKT